MQIRKHCRYAILLDGVGTTTVVGMGDYDDPELTAADHRRRPWLTTGAVVLALVVGSVGGFLVGGGTGRTSSVSSVEAAAEPPPSTTPAAPPDPATPPPCLQAGVAASRVLQELDAAVGAVGALDPTALRQILDRLQPVQTELEGSVAACGSATAPPGPNG